MKPIPGVTTTEITVETVIEKQQNRLAMQSLEPKYLITRSSSEWNLNLVMKPNVYTKLSSRCQRCQDYFHWSKTKLKIGIVVGNIRACSRTNSPVEQRTEWTIYTFFQVLHEHYGAFTRPCVYSEKFSSVSVYEVELKREKERLVWFCFAYAGKRINK